MKEKSKVSIVNTIIGALITGVIGWMGGTRYGEKETYVEVNNYIQSATSEADDYKSLVNKYDKTIKTNSKLEKENKNLSEENALLQDEISDSVTADIKSPSVVIDGMKSEQNWNKSTAIIGDTNYYSENLLNNILESKISYDSDKNTLFYNSKGQDISSVTKVDALLTNVIYEGTGYEVINSSSGKEISMGSQTYNKGLEIWDDESLFGGGNGYALFDLQGKYSKLEFDVGRTNANEKENVDLKVYLDNECKETYHLNAETPPVHYEISLNYANSMKLEISGGTRVVYGFVNMILYY